MRRRRRARCRRLLRRARARGRDGRCRRGTRRVSCRSRWARRSGCRDPRPRGASPAPAGASGRRGSGAGTTRRLRGETTRAPGARPVRGAGAGGAAGDGGAARSPAHSGGWVRHPSRRRGAGAAQRRGDPLVIPRRTESSTDSARERRIVHRIGPTEREGGYCLISRSARSAPGRFIPSTVETS